jgi:frataxin-like iron-binding protein CyaY
MDDYYIKADCDAVAMLFHFEDDILDMLLYKGAASADIYNDYPNGDSYHFESHVDRWYSLKDAAILLDALSEYKETDSGLWQGQEPSAAIDTQAAFTYGNAVLCHFVDYIKELNADYSDMESVRAEEWEDEYGDEDDDKKRAAVAQWPDEWVKNKSEE